MRSTSRIDLSGQSHKYVVFDSILLTRVYASTPIHKAIHRICTAIIKDEVFLVYLVAIRRIHLSLIALDAVYT